MKIKHGDIKKGIILLMFVICYMIFRQYYYSHDSNSSETMIMGGKFNEHVVQEDNNILNTDGTRKEYFMTDGSMKENIMADGSSKDTLMTDKDVETYFRPSSLPVLNNRFTWRYFDQFREQKNESIVIPTSLMSTPKDVILNYFSILREADNLQKGKYLGCGSVGWGRTPYPVAYQFLSSEYQKKLPYESYLTTFENIGHINLIKYREVPLYDNPAHIIRFFVEIETIEGSEKHIGNFAYYYGFVDLVKEKDHYKISNLQYYGEDYLCAPYHGWSYIAEATVQIRYGGWCSMIKELYPTLQEGYVKNIIFQGTDGEQYLIVFYRLTNDTDLEIAQYKKDERGSWQLIKLEPEKCLEDKDKK